jgi:1-acyl-sn-glycerol-3-phosphate acyltransferase
MNLTLRVPGTLPRRGTALGRAVGRLVLRALGWRVVGAFPDASKLVLIAAPHRSNWDFVVGLAAKTALGLDVSWLGKHTLFRNPWGVLFRWWGGIPVDRGASHDMVTQVVQSFGRRDSLALAIAPEGTRAPGVRWKTGFWHIARGAGVPIVPVAFDWAHRLIRIMPALEPRELEADMRELQARYAEFRGRVKD